MTLNELMDKVVRAYPGGKLFDYWDYQLHQPRRGPEAEKTLAYFIVCELYRTYDANAPDEKQIEQVCNIVDEAVLTLEEFERVMIYNKAIESRKGKNGHK